MIKDMLYCIPIALGLLVLSDTTLEPKAVASPSTPILTPVPEIEQTLPIAKPEPVKEEPVKTAEESPQFVSTTFQGGCSSGSCAMPAQAPQQYRSGVFRGGRRFAILPRNRRR